MKFKEKKDNINEIYIEDAILSEESLKETWLNEEEDEAWKDL